LALRSAFAINANKISNTEPNYSAQLLTRNH
jgi:hypothetical protein